MHMHLALQKGSRERPPVRIRMQACTLVYATQHWMRGTHAFAVTAHALSAAGLRARIARMPSWPMRSIDQLLLTSCSWPAAVDQLTLDQPLSTCPHRAQDRPRPIARPMALTSLALCCLWLWPAYGFGLWLVLRYDLFETLRCVPGKT